jgi:predicted phosphohydrolase
VRIVSASDTHLFHRDLAVPDGDVFIHAGDLCRIGTLDELADAAAWIRSLPHETKIVVAGNHDWAFAREAQAARDILGPGILYLEDSGAVVDGVRFWGSPWQPEFMGWAFNLPRGPALAAKWALIPTGLDVLVTHGPPRGIGDRSAVGREGCDDLRERVRVARPRLHIFGHIHEDGGVWEAGGTMSANVTTDCCLRPPTVIDYDAQAREARAVSVPPRRSEP